MEKPTQTPWMVPYPSDLPPRYNGSSSPCDMLYGPCSCGATHVREPVLATVSFLQAMDHAKAPCRYCGHKFENGACCGSGMSHCPACGCPVQKPL